MKEALLILVLLIASSCAIDSRLPINRLKQSVTNTKGALNPAVQPQKQPSTVPAAPAPRFEEVTLPGSSSSTAGPAVVVDSTGTDSSSTGGHIKRTPGAPCNTYTLCSECTDDESKAFYCMWSAARNVCQEDTDMDKLKRANPGDLWTKECGPKDPEPITDCQGCPISPLDKKPERDIIDSQIKGSDGKYALATEGSLHRINPRDPITGSITNPNGTSNPMYLLPSIRDADGNIKDPVQDQEKLTYSPCVGDAACDGSSRFVSSARKGKFAPIVVGSDEDKPEQDSETSEPRMKHVPHVDKVEMQDAAEHDSADVETIEISSSTKKDSSEGFTPTYSDDDSSPSQQSSNSQQSSRTSEQPQQDSSSTDAPRFTQSKRSSSQSMSAAKSGTNSVESTMEVTEYDENVIGGKKINEDADSKASPEEADDKQ